MSHGLKLIPVGVSNRHIHICQQDLETLFGKDHRLEVFRPISQKGQYAAKQSVDVVGPKGQLDGVRLVGPTRPQTQVEISRTDAFRLGLDPPVRYSSDLSGTPAVKLAGPHGQLQLSAGVIIPQRHIHMSPREAGDFGVKDRDRVFVAPFENGQVLSGNEPRSIIFGNVLVRVDPSFVLDFHIDVDEANAAGLKTGDHVYIIKKDKPAKTGHSKRLITENDVRQAMLGRRKIRVAPGTIVTPAARDLARAHDVFDED